MQGPDSDRFNSLNFLSVKRVSGLSKRQIYGSKEFHFKGEELAGVAAIRLELNGVSYFGMEVSIKLHNYF